LKRYTLPNGLALYHHSKGETDIIYREVWQNDSYLAEKRGLVLEPGAIVVDAGANIGLFSLFVRERCQGDVRIYAFEPVPEIHAILAANAELWFSDHLGAMKTFAFGLSDHEIETTMLQHPKMSIWSTAHANFDTRRSEQMYRDVPAIVDFALKSEAWLRWLPRSWVEWGARKVARVAAETREIRCQLRRLSSVIEEEDIERIDLLKADVEGSELELLRGIDSAHWRRIQQLVLEVEEIATRTVIEELLASKGFRTVHQLAHEVHDTGIDSELSYVWASRR
jgi:FkbM family methyltransferase